MWQKTKDSAASWQQRSWQFAVERHGRLSELQMSTSNAKVLQYCQEQLQKLELDYPQLQTVPGATPA